jgi:XcyI-like restriction endonuclease
VTIKLLDPSRQVIFHQALVAARKTTLIDALREALAQIDPKTIKEQLTKYAPSDAQKILAASGIRDEHVFPVPIVLQTKPTLIAYYRLLLGISQKRFYRKGTGMSPYKSMEQKGVVNVRKPPDINEFCFVMSEHLAEMVRQISPPITARDSSRHARCPALRQQQ